jgi:hypothetical protein
VLSHSATKPIIERAIQSIEDVPAFGSGDTIELAGQIVDEICGILPIHIATGVLQIEIANLIGRRLKNHVDREAVIDALAERLADLLEEEFKHVQQDTLRETGTNAE